MQLTSDVLKPDHAIPVRYTKDGDDISPPLQWSGLPRKTRELVLTFDNITPQTQELFTQWLVYRIPGEMTGLPEGFKHEKDPKTPADVLQGRNSQGNIGYDGPLGTVGQTHRYQLHLYALDTQLDVPPGADKTSVFDAMSGHVLDEAELTVMYERPRG